MSIKHHNLNMFIFNEQGDKMNKPLDNKKLKIGDKVFYIDLYKKSTDNYKLTYELYNSFVIDNNGGDITTTEKYNYPQIFWKDRDSAKKYLQNTLLNNIKDCTNLLLKLLGEK